VRKQHQALIEHYQLQIEATEAELMRLMDTDPGLKQRVETLDAIEGVGRRTALMVLTHMPELGQLNRQQVAALAGLAPWTRESGTMKGIRCTAAGLVCSTPLVSVIVFGPPLGKPTLSPASGLPAGSVSLPAIVPRTGA
jgi:hypothetical protein